MEAVRGSQSMIHCSSFLLLPSFDMWSSTRLCHSHRTEALRRSLTFSWRSSHISLMSALQCQHNFHTTPSKTCKLTSESPDCRVDSPENHTDAQLLNPAEGSHSGPDVSDVSGGRGWTSELRPQKNS
ncbi:unnamed protein product [Ophioblennius macclurei]